MSNCKDVYIIAHHMYSGPVEYSMYLMFDDEHNQFCWGMIYDALYCTLETAQSLVNEFGGEVKSVYTILENVERSKYAP